MAELSESITQLPAGDDLAALLLKRWTSGAADDAPENTSDDGSWVDVTAADENKQQPAEPDKVAALETLLVALLEQQIAELGGEEAQRVEAARLG